jgi:hypothetical protein
LHFFLLSMWVDDVRSTVEDARLARTQKEPRDLVGSLNLCQAIALSGFTVSHLISLQTNL